MATSKLTDTFGLTRQDAEESVSHAFEKLLSLKDSVEEKGRNQWMRHVIFNCLKNMMKKIRPIELPGDFVDNKAQDSLQILEKNLGEKEKEIEALKECISLLPKKYRSIILLRFYQKMSYREIHQMMAIPEGTIRTQCFRSMESLEKCLRKKGIQE